MYIYIFFIIKEETINTHHAEARLRGYKKWCLVEVHFKVVRHLLQGCD